MFQDNEIGAMVKLPRLNGPSAVSLASQLLSAAEEEGERGLPLLVERQRVRLQTATEALKAGLSPEGDDASIRAEADLALDDAWRLFSTWLGSSAWLPEGLSADLERLRDLYALLFGEGLSTCVFAYREEWILSEMRLQALAEGCFEPLIERLGGGPFVTYIKIAHAKYTEVQGIDEPVKMGENPAMRRCLSDLVNEIKSYIMKAAAIADADDPGSQFMSGSLLRPLSQWTDTAQSYRDTIVDEEPVKHIGVQSVD